MLNKIMLPADADVQRARLTSAGTALTGHLAETGSAGAGLVVRIRPWTASVLSKTSVLSRRAVTRHPSALPQLALCLPSAVRPPVGAAQHGRCQRPVRPQAGPGEGP